MTSTKCILDWEDCQMTLHFSRCIAGVMQKTSDVIWQDAQHQVLFQLLDEVEQESSA